MTTFHGEKPEKNNTYLFPYEFVVNSLSKNHELHIFHSENSCDLCPARVRAAVNLRERPAPGLDANHRNRWKR